MNVLLTTLTLVLALAIIRFVPDYGRRSEDRIE